MPGVLPGVAASVLERLIASLFGDGQQGALYVPQPVVLGSQALYQDAAGTTPVEADGDPVGLMLDVSRKLELGPELVTNGNFDAGLTGWTTGSNLTSTIIDGEAEVTLGGAITSSANNWFFPDALLDQFSVYEISFDATYISGAGYLQIGVSYNEIQRIDSVDNGGVRQRYTVMPIADSPSFNGRVSFGGSAGGVWRIDNVSVRELPGIHASQSTSGAKKLYRTDGTLYWLEDDLFDDAITATFPDLGTNATLAYADASGVTILAGQTISGDTDLPSVAELYGAIYLDRPFTSSQEAQVTDYLNSLRAA